ncbi:MAG TPA: hypothetical protein VE991_02645, partial [Acidimicrobiales bacterium]|nr:hypothetical protein [Acidimicrobiales bacterium]
MTDRPGEGAQHSYGRRAGRHLLRWYPAGYRERYGEELGALIDDELAARPHSVRIRLDVARAGLGERARAGALAGSGAGPDDRARAYALVVLCGWALCTAAGAALAKYAEHWDAGLSWPAKRWSEAGFDVMSVAALIGGAAVVAAGLVCVGPLLAWWRGGGLRAQRRPLVAALVASALWLTFFGLVAGSNGVAPGTTPQGGLHWLGVAFVVCGLAALACVTRAGVAVARRLTIDRRRLRLLVGLATVVGAAMTLVLGGAALWWVALPAPGKGAIVLGPVLRVGSTSVDAVVIAVLLAMAL